MDFVDFGKYLTQQRELRGLSREDVSRETKIPPSLLMALETGQAERLPERVFVINFLKAYARVVGLEEDEVLLRYEEVSGSAENLEHLGGKPPSIRGKRAPLSLAAVVGVIIAIAVTLYLLQQAA